MEDREQSLYPHRKHKRPEAECTEDLGLAEKPGQRQSQMLRNSSFFFASGPWPNLASKFE